MDGIFSQEYTLRAVDVDIKGMWMPSAIFVMMQEVAELHAQSVGFGRGDVTSKFGVAWVIARTRLQMETYPRLGEPIIARTWSLAPTNLMFRRQFQFSDLDGNELGRGSSQWILLDLEDRVIRRSSILGPFPYDPDAVAIMPDPKKVRVPKDLLEMQKRRVLYSDVDMNGHMNNTKYLNWICELFPTHFLKSMQMRDVEIAYVTEARIDQEVTLFGKDEEDGMFVCGRSGEKDVFDAKVRWEEIPSLRS